MTDSTINPAKEGIFFNERFMPPQYEEWYIFTYSLVNEGASTDDVGVAKGNVFQ